MLRCEQLSVRYGLVQVLREVNLAVAAGELVAIVGESGVGKSTLLRACAGVLSPQAEVTGRVWCDGQELPVPLGRVVALVPQSGPTFLTAVRTVGSQLRETAWALRGVALTETAAVALLARVDLGPHVLGLFPHQLSGGMAQRLALAFALVGEPPILLVDEPTAGLESDLVDRQLALLRAQADAGAAVALITHDIAAVLRTEVADRCVVLHRGQVVADGAAVLREPTEKYVQQLLAALPANGLHCPQEVK